MPEADDRSKPQVKVLRYGKLRRGDRGDRARIHPARQIGAELDVADQLAVDRLAEQPPSSSTIFVVGRRLAGLAEVEVPILRGLQAGASAAGRASA